MKSSIKKLKSSQSTGQQVAEHARRSPCESMAYFAANNREQMTDEKLVEGLCPDCAQLFRGFLTRCQKTV